MYPLTSIHYMGLKYLVFQHSFLCWKKKIGKCKTSPEVSLVLLFSVGVFLSVILLTNHHVGVLAKCVCVRMMS